MPTTRRTLTLALLLVAASALIFTTGAAVIDGDADTVADGDLAVQPADGPNGQYAYLNDDGEIAIDISASNPNIKDPSFEGVNVGSTGRIDGVFEITYTGDRYAEVWIGYPNESVTFVAGGDSVEGRANNVTLAPNQTVTVGLEFDTRGAEAGTQLGADEFAIEARIADPEDADDVPTATTSNAQARGEDGATITVTAPNATAREFDAWGVGYGDAVEFDAGGMHLAGGNVTLDGVDLAGVRTDNVDVTAVGGPDPTGGGTVLTAPTDPRPVGYLSLERDFAPDAVDEMTVRFSADRDHLDATGTDPRALTLYRRTAAGDWVEVPVSVVDEEAARIQDLPEDRVHFRATTSASSTFAVAAHGPRFDVTATDLDPQAIDPGDEAAVRATLRNGGGAAGERRVTLTANGDPVANRTVALAPNETTTVALAGTFPDAGEYDLAVAGADAGTLLVGDPAGEGSESDGTDAGTDTGATADENARGGASSVDGGDEPGAGSTDEPGAGSADDPTEEPSAIDLVELGGLLAGVTLSLAGIALVRRLQRS